MFNKSLLVAASALFAAQVFAGPVNVNTASAEELATELNGVGSITAQRIVDYRSNKGQFTKPEQLADVRGIGPRTLEKNREFILVQ